jgi:cation transport ATPase
MGRLPEASGARPRRGGQAQWLLELVIALLERLHGHDAVGLGTLLDSSLFNGLAIVGVGAVLHPIRVPFAEVAAALGFGVLSVLLMLPRSAWPAFLDQFRNVLTAVLIGAAGLAWAIGDLKDAAVILAVVVFNAALGFYQEHRAERTLAALKGMLAQQARVRRDGRVVELGVEALVPGDVVLLEAGDRIPADGRFVVAHNVEVDEAALTGESLAWASTRTRFPPKRPWRSGRTWAS